MATEQDRTLGALKIALQMEIDGKEYYQKVAKDSSNKLGRELFQALAMEEDIHRQKFEEIYSTISHKKAWPKTDFRPDKGARLRNIFATAIQEMGSNVKTLASELEAIQTAMSMENKTYDFYKSQNTSYDTERELYEALAAEERGHYLVLRDYSEYLTDPAGWFIEKEHPSLDGG